ncbi:MAG: JAB domain-containing protein [Sphingomonas sp.]
MHNGRCAYHSPTYCFASGNHVGQELRLAVAATIKSGAEAIAFLAPMLPVRGDRETLIVLYLDAQDRVVDHAAFPGDETGVDIPVRKILVHAILRDARGLLIAHNHPSGDPTPSEADVVETRKLAVAVRPLGMALHDHLIRAGNEWRSLAAMDLI